MITLEHNKTLLIARLLMGALFLVAGVAKLLNPDGFVGWLGSMGFPAVIAWGVIAFEILAGIAFAIGLKVKWVGLAIAAFCVATAFIGHNVFADIGELNGFFKNLSLAGGFAYVALVADKLASKTA